jgi:hypothetical protein
MGMCCNFEGSYERARGCNSNSNRGHIFSSIALRRCTVFANANTGATALSAQDSDSGLLAIRYTLHIASPIPGLALVLPRPQVLALARESCWPEQLGSTPHAPRR